MNSRHIAFLFLLTIIVACKKDEIVPYDEASLDISPCYGLVLYDGPMATDAARDAVDMADEDTYWEAAGFNSRLVITWDGNSVHIQGAPWVKRTVSDADVVLDIAENKKLEIILRGSSGNGSLKVYGAKKFKLTFSGLDLQSARGAAINLQCPKRVFAHLTDGTVNRICDASVYRKTEGEDMKGCFFAEGDIIFSGKGVLLVDGRGQNGIASDDGIVFRPGVTVVSSVTADAGKAVKANECIEMKGGLLSLSTSGNAYYDEAEKDDKSSACMSADSAISLHGGILTASAPALLEKESNRKTVYLSMRRVRKDRISRFQPMVPVWREKTTLLPPRESRRWDILRCGAVSCPSPNALTRAWRVNRRRNLPFISVAGNWISSVRMTASIRLAEFISKGAISWSGVSETTGLTPISTEKAVSYWTEAMSLRSPPLSSTTVALTRISLRSVSTAGRCLPVEDRSGASPVRPTKRRRCSLRSCSRA